MKLIDFKDEIPGSETKQENVSNEQIQEQSETANEDIPVKEINLSENVTTEQQDNDSENKVATWASPNYSIPPKEKNKRNMSEKDKIIKIARIASEVIAGILLIVCFSMLIKADKKYASLNDEYEMAKYDATSTTTRMDALQISYDAYKAKMKPYEEMEVAAAEAKKIEAEKVVADKKAADEKAAADAAAAKAAEVARGYETGITYDQLARTPDSYNGQKVKFYGKVVQVMEGDLYTQIRLAVDDNYDTMLFCEYLTCIIPSRILENDYITVYGNSVGTVSYDSTMGGTITIPGVDVDKVDQ